MARRSQRRSFPKPSTFPARVFISPTGIHPLDELNEELLGSVPEVFGIEPALKRGEVKGKTYSVDRSSPQWMRAVYG